MLATLWWSMQTSALEVLIFLARALREHIPATSIASQSDQKIAPINAPSQTVVGFMLVPSTL